MVVTFVTSIPAYFILYALMRNNPDSITGAGADPTASVALGVVLELILIIANIGTAVVPYALFRRMAKASLWATSQRASSRPYSSLLGLSAFSDSCSCGRKAQLAPTPLWARRSWRSMIGRS